MLGTNRKIPNTNIRADSVQAWWLPERVLDGPAGVLRAGVESTPSPWQTNRSTKGYHTIILVLHGTFRCDHDMGSFSAGPGTLINLPAHLRRQCILTSDDMKIAVFWLIPSRSWARFEMAGTGAFPSTCGPPVEKLLMLLHAESLLRQVESDDVGRGLLQALLGYLERMAEEVGGHTPHRHKRALARLWQAVHANPSHPWDPEGLAERLHISSTHLRRLCLDFFGCTTGRMVTQIRMDVACQLLAEGEETMETVAHRVGYANAYSFSRAFRATVGERPGSYRTRLHTGDGV